MYQQIWSGQNHPDQKKLESPPNPIMIANHKYFIHAGMFVPLSLGRVGTEAIVVLAKLLSAFGIREHFTTQPLAQDTLYEASAKRSPL